MGRKASPLRLSEGQRRALREITRARHLPIRGILQASALLLAARGWSNEEVARHFGVTPRTVATWRAKFDRWGVESIRAEGHGLVAPSGFPGRLARHDPSAGQPGTVVGLYLNPVQRVLALSDEVCTADRQVIPDGRVSGPRDLLRFLKYVNLTVPRRYRIDLVADQLSPLMTHFEVDRWMVNPKRERVHLHVAPSRTIWNMLTGRWLQCPCGSGGLGGRDLAWFEHASGQWVTRHRSRRLAVAVAGLEEELV